MSGKFVNVKRKEAIDSLVTGFKNNILSNPYYQYNDKSATIVDYFNINCEASSLDEALKLYEALIGSNSPIKYNKISGFYLYGIERIQAQIELGDFGLQSEIEGEAIVLPNTIIPIPGDYFRITYTDKHYIFKVTSVTQDTIESGVNFFKINYVYDKDTDAGILEQLESEYTFMANNIGTQFKPLLKNNDYLLLETLDDILISLKKYYKNLFYSHRVESFIFSNFNQNFYDPFLTEFIIRNKLLDGDGEFIYITQQIVTHSTFYMDYMNSSVFNNIEQKDKDSLSNAKVLYGTCITQPLSLLSIRKEAYYGINLCDPSNVPPLLSMTVFTDDEIASIKNNILVEPASYMNIIINWFNGVSISTRDIDILESINYQSCQKLFYMIPILIYILEYNIKKLLV